MNLRDQVALVTGASRGIGFAIATELARQGARVVGTATTECGAETISTALAATNGRGIVLNVGEAAAIDTQIDYVQKEFGGLHILVNNAGIARDSLGLRMKDDDWAEVIEIDLSAVFRLCRAALRGMLRARAGRIINITSVVGSAGNAGQANYAAAKAGVAGMTRALAREVGGRGVTVNCIAPGLIDTDMTRSLSAAQLKALADQIPLGRLGRPEDIAAAVAFLASSAAGYITGSTLHVNGGMYMN